MFNESIMTKNERMRIVKAPVTTKTIFFVDDEV
jgi:hypothetical protein